MRQDAGAFHVWGNRRGAGTQSVSSSKHVLNLPKGVPAERLAPEPHASTSYSAPVAPKLKHTPRRFPDCFFVGAARVRYE